jgi:spore maturation protein CgeB
VAGQRRADRARRPGRAPRVLQRAWDGIVSLLEPGREILLARTPEEVLRLLTELPEAERRAVGERARARVLAEHTAAHRAAELEGHALEVLAREPAA